MLWPLIEASMFFGFILGCVFSFALASGIGFVISFFNGEIDWYEDEE